MHKLLPVINHYGETMMKHWKILVGAAAIALAVNASFAGAIKLGVPQDWTASGPVGSLYQVGLDPEQGEGGSPALFIEGKNIRNGEVASVSQTIDATEWRGQYAVLSLKVKSLGEANTNYIWLRATKGNSTWESAGSSIGGKDWVEMKRGVLIDKNVDQFSFGISLRGNGAIWVRDVKLTKQAEAPPKQGRPIDLSDIVLGSPYKEATNLNFSK